MKSLVLIMIMLMSSMSAFKAEARELDYSVRWCREVGEVIRAALNGSHRAETYEEESALLLQAVKVSLKKTPEKGNEYFLTTLYGTLEGLKNYVGAKDKVFYLRAQLSYALLDVQFINSRFSCPLCEGDHSKYVKAVISRGLYEGLSAKTDKQEIFALDHAANQAIDVLDDSFFRRSYACTKKILEESLEMSDVESKANLMREAMESLGNRSFCRQSY